MESSEVAPDRTFRRVCFTGQITFWVCTKCKYCKEKYIYRNKSLKIELKTTTTTIRAIKITCALSLICLYHGLGTIRHSKKITSPTIYPSSHNLTYSAIEWFNALRYIPSLFTANGAKCKRLFVDPNYYNNASPSILLPIFLFLSIIISLSFDDLIGVRN